MKNVLVSGYIGFNNFGDEAIFYALSSHLKKNGFSVSALCNNCDEVKKEYDVNVFHFKKPFEILKAILKCDILISGGGSLLQNKTSNFSLFYYLFIIFLAKIFFKKVIIFAQGIEPIIGKIPELATMFILKMTNFISVRDEKSRKYLKLFNIDATLVSDPAYSLVQEEKISQNKSGIIVQLRQFKGIDSEFIQNLAWIISQISDEKIKVFSFQDEIDEKICLEFIQELKKYGVSADYISAKSPQDTINIINNSKYVISTRLHGLIISSALKSKTLALSYDEKIKTLCNELDIEQIDIFNYSKEEMFDKIKKLFKQKEEKKYPYRRFDWDKIDEAINK